MAKKRYNIRWRESDVDELQRAINNFNAKLYREQKRDPTIADALPPRAKKSAIVDRIKTRADFNREIKALERLKKPNAMDVLKGSRGVQMTKWQYDEAKRRQRAENRRKEKERAKIEQQDVKIAGKSTGVARAQMGSIKDNSLKPTNPDPLNKTREEFVRYWNSLEKRLGSAYQDERTMTMRENYLKGLHENNFLDNDPELESLITSVSLEKFLETAELDETATFLFYKDPLGFAERARGIREAWENAYLEEHGKPYKG